MRVKTGELEGAPLDWAVAKIEGTPFDTGNAIATPEQLLAAWMRQWQRGMDNYSTDWAHGGGLLDETSGLQIKQWLESKSETRSEVHINNYEGDWVSFGPTTLTAFMRCYVAMKLGDEVDIPDDVIELATKPRGD